MQKIQELYAIERDARQAGLNEEQRKELRLDKSLPIMNQLGKLMTEMNKTAVPKSPMGIALNYATQRCYHPLDY